jgi:hopene-associated glycosyltransferase HpnB
MPARDEADMIATAVASLLGQAYPGDFRIVLVDDESADGTGEVARSQADRLGEGARLEVLRGLPLAAGWTGKLWAMSQGAARAGTAPDYLWFTDADIVHDPGVLAALVARAEAGRLTLVSLMVELRCQTFAERMLIPAFVFFFQVLYPFGLVNRPSSSVAAAAGGCMLVRRDALVAVGGLQAIRNSLIDDCALGAALKRRGPIWLGLSHRSRSLRPYPTIGSIGHMVSRSAYAQLGYSSPALVGAIAGLGITYLAPPLIAIFGGGAARLTAALAWASMALAFQPTLRFYRRSPLWGLVLPVIAALYAIFTLQSAVEVLRGRGGMWKGRAQAQAGSA